MSFAIYAVGFSILIAGLMYAAHLMHVPSHWMISGGIVLAGIGLLSAVKATRQKDPAN
jgi:protein-S-isoprenylcysteine O-methyltransferase Ste14